MLTSVLIKADKERMMNKLAKIVRIITVAPVMALLLCSVLLAKGGAYNGLYMYFVCLFCLGVLPALAYAIEHKTQIVAKRHPELSSRECMRRLAIYMSNIGYIALIVVVYTTQQPALLKEMALTYLFSGMLIYIFSIILNIDASGHSCGFIGPVVFMAYNVSWWFLSLLPLFFILAWSSLKLKRHTPFQVVLGALIPVFSFVLAVAIV